MTRSRASFAPRCGTRPGSRRSRPSWWHSSPRHSTPRSSPIRSAEETMPDNATQDTGLAVSVASIIQQGRLARSEAQQARARELVGEFVDEALTRESPADVEPVALVNECIARIDQQL